MRKEDQNLKKVVVFKPRSVIHTSISRIPSTLEQRIYDLGLKKAKERINYFSSIEKYRPIVEDWQKGIFELVPSITISITELKRYFPTFQKKGKKGIYDFFLKMEEIRLEKVNILKKDEDRDILIVEEANSKNIKLKDSEFELVDSIDIMRMISNVSISFSQDKVTFYLPPIIIAYLANPNMYANINLLVLNFLRKSHSISLYELLTDVYENQKRKQIKSLYETGKIHISKVKEIFGLSKEKYKLYGDFKKWVLIPAIEEINNSDVIAFEVDIEEEKKGKKIEYINFLIAEKDTSLIKDVVITSDGVEKVPLYSKDTNSSNSNEKLSQIYQLKTQVLNKKISFLRFKKQLMEIPNTEICNNVGGRLKHLILRTNELGYIELYDKQEDQIIEINNKDANEIKKWLFQNANRIGDFQEIEEDKLALYKKELIGFFITGINIDGQRYILRIDELELTKDDKNKVVAKAFSVVDHKEIKLAISIEILDEWCRVKYGEEQMLVEIEKIKKANR